MNLSPLGALAVALLTCPNSPAAADTTEAATVEAIWRIQMLPLQFYSPRTLYACDALEKKIRGILEAVGAHSSSIVDARCHGRAKVNSVSIQLTVATPIIATEENIRLMTTFTTADQMVARMHGRALPTPESIDRFAATRKKVPLTRDRKVRLEEGDCDLMHDLNEQVFPRLSVQLHSNIQCTRSARLVRANYEAEALIPLPVNDKEGSGEIATRDAVWTK